MSKSLNFNNLKKKYLAVTLADDNQTTVMISAPTKRVLSAIIGLKDTMTEIEETNNISEETLDELYSLTAEIMSHNKGGVKIEAELLEEIFDFEDIMTFFDAYMDFINEETAGKN
jgi:hypothetical protein|nr:MAG TPA: hypothetical protein [Caudoviricetes sp.]